MKALCGYLGAVKVLSQVIPRISTMLGPLEEATTGKESASKIHWSELLKYTFKKVQSQLGNNQAITIPMASDKLWLVTDVAKMSGGLAATLYITRGDRRYLSGFFSAKMRKPQLT